MTIALSANEAPSMALDDVAARKAFRRLIWYIFVIYSISYLDRLNLGMAALSMNKELGLSALTFGIAGTVMYVGYALCEVPSNIIMARVGARVWISRIMITWGFASMATMLATGPYSLYFYRVLVGIAEAGFVPGIVLYLTYWFPRSYRAKALSLFLVAGAFSLVFSAISGLILEMNGFMGLSGWRWLFLLEGAPAVVFGVITLFYLTDKPATAKWLSEEEKKALQRRLDQEHADEEAAVGKRGSMLSQVVNSSVLLLAIAYFGQCLSFNAGATWSPQIIKQFATQASFASIGFIAAFPPLVSVILMPMWSWRSDRLKERNRHLYLPLLLAAVGWLLVIGSDDGAVRLLGLTLATLGNYCAQPILWALPGSSMILSPKARAAGIGLISAIGITGSIVSPLIIGYLKDLTGSFTPGLLFIAGMLVVSAVCSSIVARRCKAMA